MVETYRYLGVFLVKPYHNLVDRLPGDRRFIPLFIGFQPSKVVQDIFHAQYLYFY